MVKVMETVPQTISFDRNGNEHSKVKSTHQLRRAIDYTAAAQQTALRVQQGPTRQALLDIGLALEYQNRLIGKLYEEKGDIVDFKFKKPALLSA